MLRANTFRKFLYLIGRERRWRWLVVVVLAVVAGGLEIVGAMLVFLLLGMIADPGGSLSLPLLGQFPDLRSEGQDSRLLMMVTGGIAVFFVIRAGIRVGQAYLQHRMVHKAAARISKRMVRGYLGMPYAAHLQRNSAELIRNGHDATRSLANHVFLPVVSIVAESILLSGLIGLLVLTAPLATALALAFMGPTVYVLARLVQPRLERLGRLTHQMSYDALSTLQQSLRGLRDIKILGKESPFSAHFGRTRDAMAHAQYQLGTVQELPRTFIETALLLFILAYFAFALNRGSEAAETLPVLGLFAYVGLRMQPSLQTIVRGLNSLKFSSAALNDVYDDLLMLDREAHDHPDHASPTMPFREAIVLSGVAYAYEGTDQPAIRDVNLRIRRGDFVGICGPTGGGKTTLMDLITGLLAPSAGSIRVDGADIATHVRSWQANLGVVPQNVFLVDDTLRSNIALGVPEEQIDHQAVKDAIRMAQLEEFVGSLPEGMDTRVGEHGVRLSGGQRQRVAIARSLYRQPAVLIMDEGTSALDNVTEGHLVDTLERVRGERTILVVAHRLSSVKACDYIAFVDGGRIVAVAPYGELLETNSTFREMATRT